jgi:hypothetical protein
MTTTTFTIGYPPSKKDIIQRLFEAEHIDFNEMWILLQDEPEVKYIPMPQEPQYPMGPWTTPDIQPYYTNDCNNPRLHHTGRGTSSPEQS